MSKRNIGEEILESVRAIKRGEGTRREVAVERAPPTAGDKTTKREAAGSPGVRGNIVVPERQVADVCRRSHIRRLAFFGSVLRADFGPESDVDVVVEFEKGRTPSLLRMAALERELSGLLGRRVDLRTPAELSRYFRDEVLREREVAYAQE